jgi:CheY-like chemotaxis protein
MAERTEVIIDDEPDVTTYLGTMLTDRGWEVRTANAADEGLALVRDHRPDAVLLDLMMPKRGGLSVLIELRRDEELSSVPIVIVSGIQSALDADFRAFLARFKYRKPDAFLDKPVDPDELIAVLERLTAGAE